MGQRTAIYARVHTADQSCERQAADLTAFAERGGFEVLGIFTETASGARNNRLVRNRVLEFAEARRIDAVLVSSIRQLADCGRRHCQRSRFSISGANRCTLR